MSHPQLCTACSHQHSKHASQCKHCWPQGTEDNTCSGACNCSCHHSEVWGGWGMLTQEDIMSIMKIPATSWKTWIENGDMFFEPPLLPPQSPICSTPTSPKPPTPPMPHPSPKPPSSPAKSTSAKSYQSTSSWGLSLSWWLRLSKRSQERIMDEISKHFE